jgi:hypothetical protein
MSFFDVCRSLASFLPRDSASHLSIFFAVIFVIALQYRFFQVFAFVIFSYFSCNFISFMFSGYMSYFLVSAFLLKFLWVCLGGGTVCNAYLIWLQPVTSLWLGRGHSAERKPGEWLKNL